MPLPDDDEMTRILQALGGSLATSRATGGGQASSGSNVTSSQMPAASPHVGQNTALVGTS
jgi:hypothetical protein